MDKLLGLWQSTGIYQIEAGQALMIAVCMGLIYLAIRKGFGLCYSSRFVLVVC